MAFSTMNLTLALYHLIHTAMIRLYCPRGTSMMLIIPPSADDARLSKNSIHRNGTTMTLYHMHTFVTLIILLLFSPICPTLTTSSKMRAKTTSITKSLPLYFTITSDLNAADPYTPPRPFPACHSRRSPSRRYRAGIPSMNNRRLQLL